MWRFTRLTNALKLKFVWYNFCKPQGSLGGNTSARAAGVALCRWDLRWIRTLINR